MEPKNEEEHEISSEKIISGKWENELHSKVELKATPDGLITGAYYTAVGNAKQGDVKGSFSPIRKENLPPTAKYVPGSATVSLTVHWDNPIEKGKGQSMTIWGGPLRLTEDNSWVIDTLWQLTNVTDDQNLWKTWLTNKNLFKKVL